MNSSASEERRLPHSVAVIAVSMLVALQLPALLLQPLYPETLIVTNTLTEGEGNLRWAVDQANERAGTADTILFAIPTSDPGYDGETGVWTISADSLDLPDEFRLTDDGTVIDGSSQAEFIGADANPFGPELQLSGIPEHPNGCFSLTGQGITIRELCMNGYHYGGVVFVNGLEDDVQSMNTVVGCYVNTDPTGNERIPGGDAGIMARLARGIRIGGYAVEDRNIISGAGSVDVMVEEVEDIEIINNYIGADRTGTNKLSEGFGPTLSIVDIEDSLIIRDNLIVGEGFELVRIVNAPLDEHSSVFQGNQIGVDAAGQPMGAEATGVSLVDVSGLTVTDNIIANAYDDFCVTISGFASDYVTLSQNSIYGYGILGFNLDNPHNQSPFYVDLIDGQYGDGVNEEIDPCLCDSIVTLSEGGRDQTKAYFTCMRDCIVELFAAEPGSDIPCPEPGYGAVHSGVTYLGDAEETEQDAVWSTYAISISPAPPAGTSLTSTATNQNGSTSEFGCSCEVPLAGESSQGCLPTQYRLFPPIPNPCRDSTALRYHVSAGCHVRVLAYDAQGKLVATIRDEHHETGIYETVWRIADDNGTRLPSGFYVIRLQTPDFSPSQPLTVLR